MNQKNVTFLIEIINSWNEVCIDPSIKPWLIKLCSDLVYLFGATTYVTTNQNKTNTNYNNQNILYTDTMQIPLNSSNYSHYSTDNQIPSNPSNSNFINRNISSSSNNKQYESIKIELITINNNLQLFTETMNFTTSTDDLNSNELIQEFRVKCQ